MVTLSLPVDRMCLLGGYVEFSGATAENTVEYRFYQNAPVQQELLVVRDLPARFPTGASIAHFATGQSLGQANFALHARVAPGAPAGSTATVSRSRLFVETLPEFTVFASDRLGVLTVPNDAFFHYVARSPAIQVDPLSLGVPYGDTFLTFSWGFGQHWMGGPEKNEILWRLQDIDAVAGVRFDDTGIANLHTEGRVKLASTLAGGSGRVGYRADGEYLVELDLRGQCEGTPAGTVVRTDQNNFEMVVLPSTRDFLTTCPPGLGWAECCELAPDCSYDCTVPLSVEGQLPIPCWPPTLFADDFETGDALRWKVWP